MLSIHLPSAMGDGGSSAMSMLLKDTALAGSAWILAGQFEDEGALEPEA